ncbi:VanZ family protein [Kribbella sp.]|uniref:VanZ family protein n=1 Tax=Kribbella sp. TaxID=1871183 RepID=UPI002D41606A|nr:VanZ family protein [Kribbella sp.]HZX08183.1 VanZ family protein [Kribbella sp.]
MFINGQLMRNGSRQILVTPTNLIVPAAVVALAFVAWVLLRLCRLSLQGLDEQAARLARVCLALWFAGLLVVTLGGRPHDASGGVYFNWIPFAAQSTAPATENLVNLLLFVPAGLLLGWVAPHASDARLLLSASAGALLLSSLIECMQAFTPLGTAGDITDVLLNTTGCIAASAVGISVRHVLARTLQRNHRRPAGTGSVHT